MGLMEICRSLSLTSLKIGHANYKDEGAVGIARFLPLLKSLDAQQCNFGCEAIGAISSSQTQLEALACEDNPESGMRTTGRLPKLKCLNAGNTGLKSWTAVALALQLSGLSELKIFGNGVSKECIELVDQALPQVEVKI